MKKIMTFVLAGALAVASCVAFTACDNSHEPTQPNIGTLPVKATPYATSFFNVYFPAFYELAPYPGFFDNYDHDETVCLIIDNVDEFKAAAPSGATLPLLHIDFERYSLVIGQHMMGSGGYVFERQGIDAGSDPMTLNLVYYRKSGGVYSPSAETYGFWGLYPKLPEKPITVNVISYSK